MAENKKEIQWKIYDTKSLSLFQFVDSWHSIDKVVMSRVLGKFVRKCIDDGRLFEHLRKTEEYLFLHTKSMCIIVHNLTRDVELLQEGSDGKEERL